MAEDTTGGTGQADDIQNQINQVLEEINQIRNTRQVITAPDGLKAAERAILQATDKLAALMTALKIQQTVDSDELVERADELGQTIPKKLKNQGRHLVSVRTSRGTAVEVADPHYSGKRKRTNAARIKK